MSGKKHRGAPRGGDAEVITEPRFAKAHTDRRFAKIGQKDKTVHLDSRFKHIVKDRRFAIAGQKDSRGRVGDVLTKAKAKRETKELKQQFHVDSDEDKEETSDSEGPQSTHGSDVSDHAALPKTQAAQVSKRRHGGPTTESESASSAKFAVEDAEVSDESEVDDADSNSDDHWAMKARGLLERDSDAGSDDYSSGADDFSTDTEEELDEEEAEAYNEGVLQQPLEFGEETKRIAIVNCDWDRLKAVDLMVVCSSFCPSTGMVNSVTIYPSDFGLSMMKEEDLNGPAIYKDGDASEESESEEERSNGRKSTKPRDEERAAALDQIKLRRYELNKLRYYFAVVVCDSLATASALYNALDNQEIEMTSNKLDMRFVPDDISFEDRTVHDKCTVVPANYEAPSFYTTVLQKTEAKLTWDQTPKDRLDVTQAAFSHLAEIDEAKYSTLIASSESESEDAEEQNGKLKTSNKSDKTATGDDRDKSKIKEKERKRYASLLMGLDNLDDGDEAKDDFFEESAPKEMTFTLGGSGKPSKSEAAVMDVDEQIRRKVQERLSKKPNKKLKQTNKRTVIPKYRPDEEHSEDGEDGIELFPNKMDVSDDIGAAGDGSVSSDESEEDGAMESRRSGKQSKQQQQQHQKQKQSKSKKGKRAGDEDEDDEEEEEKQDSGEAEKDVWAGFEEGFDKPSKSQLAKMKKRKREDREKEMQADTKGRAELALLMQKDGGADDDDNGGATSSEEEGKPSKKKSKRGKKDKKAAVQSEIDLSDTRFHGLFKDPRFMPDPTNPNFKKTAAVSAILEARKEYRKQHAHGDEEEEDQEMPGLLPVGKHSSKPSARPITSSSGSKKTTQKGFYDLGSDNKDDSPDALASLVASVKRKAGQSGPGSLGRPLR